MTKKFYPLMAMMMLAALLLSACGVSLPNLGALNDKSQTLYIAPFWKSCEGVGPMLCMEVKDTPDGAWQLFYQNIEGFTYEPGYEYTLKVNKEEVANPPADGSSLRYTLANVVSKNAVSADAIDLSGTAWVLSNMTGGSVVPGHKITLSFDEAGKFGGSAGCNSYGGGYTLNGVTFEASQVFNTEMACAEAGVMEQERAYLDALQSMRFAKVDGDHLLMVGTDGAFMHFIKGDASAQKDFTGSSWKLVEMNGDAVASGSSVTLEFTEAGKLGGNAGCNTYGGGYSVDGSRFQSGSLFSTRMACPEPAMGQETTYMKTLQSMNAWKMDGDALVLTGADNNSLRFVNTAGGAEGLPNALSGTAWKLIDLQGETLLANSPITLEFIDGEKLGGSAGCNSYSMQYTLDGTTLTTEMAASTLMACEEAVMQQESAFLTALNAVNTLQVDGSSLTLTTADGKTLKFVPSDLAGDAPASIDLTNTGWKLVDLNGEVIVGDKPITLEFMEGGRFYGSSGCNTYNSDFTLDGATFTPSVIITTLMACEEPVMQQEATFLLIMQSVKTLQLEGRTLTLTTEDGKTLQFNRL